MKVDLFMEFPSPPGHDRRAEGALHDGIAIARAAEAAGIDAVWLAEHHFLGDYCNLAAPDMLLAAIARETSRLQLGFGILPLPIHDPVRIAERLATLDILSAGRVLAPAPAAVRVGCMFSGNRMTSIARARWGRRRMKPRSSNPVTRR